MLVVPPPLSLPHTLMPVDPPSSVSSAASDTRRLG